MCAGHSEGHLLIAVCIVRLYNKIFIHYNHIYSLKCVSYLIHTHHFPKTNFHLSASYWKPFMVLKVYQERSLVPIFTECFNIKCDLALNFFFGHAVLLLVAQLEKPHCCLLYLFLHWFQPCLSSCMHTFASFYLSFLPVSL